MKIDKQKDLKELLDATLNHSLVDDVINEAVMNWTQSFTTEPNPIVKSVLVGFAKSIARKIIQDPVLLQFDKNWKKDMANALATKLGDNEKLVDEAVPSIVEGLKGVLEDISDQLKGGLHRYSLYKIASYTSSVANMVANDADPEQLIMTEEESDKYMQKVIEIANNTGVAVKVVNLHETETVDDITTKIVTDIERDKVNEEKKKRITN